MRVFSYIALWVPIFGLSYVLLSMTSLAPAEVKEFDVKVSDFITREVISKILGSNGNATSTASVQTNDTNDPAAATPLTESVLPVRIIIEKIGVDDPVENPESRDVSILDDALSRGVVRYPGSGGLSDESNILFFGHSTNWQTVRNQAYRSFNRLSELNLGDLVKVRSREMEYLYRITSVALVDKGKALVEFRTGEKMLTLSTCDTFGAKTDRFVVEARFVRSYPLSQS